MTDADHPLAVALAYLQQLEAYGVERVPVGDPTAAAAAVNVAEGIETAEASTVGGESEAGPAEEARTAGLTAPVAAESEGGDPGAALEAFHESIRDCTACGLSAGRKTVVFGVGNPLADIMFVGEAPGADEDREGVPFVGAAGQLLTRMIEAMGLTRDDVYIANVIKCRPPRNRDPEPEEIAACRPFLERQLKVVDPDLICTLGRFAAQLLLNSTESMGRLHGQVLPYDSPSGRRVRLIPTYHPSALLRNEQWKRPTWEDLKLLRREYDGVVL